MKYCNHNITYDEMKFLSFFFLRRDAHLLYLQSFVVNKVKIYEILYYFTVFATFFVLNVDVFCSLMTRRRSREAGYLVSSILVLTR